MTLKEWKPRVDECTGVTKPAAMRTELQKQNLANIVGRDGLLAGAAGSALCSPPRSFSRCSRAHHECKIAFNNIGIRYRGSSDDSGAEQRCSALRYRTVRPREALKADGQPDGRAAHSDGGDPFHERSAGRWWRWNRCSAIRCARPGNADRLVQAYTDENQHTGQSGPEIYGALEMLMQWIEMDFKPDASIIGRSVRAIAQRL
jgi:hypothetical protein